MARRSTATRLGLGGVGALLAPLLIHAVIAVAPGATLVAFALPFIVAATVAAAARGLRSLALGLTAGAAVWILLLYLVLSGLQT